MPFQLDKTKFDEAFLYMAPMAAIWVSEYGDFTKHKIDELADLVVVFKTNPCAKSFIDEAHFKRSFREALTFKVQEAQESETRYRKDLLAGKTVKAVTAAREEIGTILKELKAQAATLNPEDESTGRFLENLRKPCRDTTLNLLYNMSAMAQGLDIDFLRPFTCTTWTPNSIEALLTYLAKLHKILGRSVKRGGVNKSQSSPIIGQLVMELGVIYAQYSLLTPGRSVAHVLVDGKDDVETHYSEGGPFKEFCIKAIALMEGETAQINDESGLHSHGSRLDSAIRKAAMSLKYNRFTGPYEGSNKKR